MFIFIYARIYLHTSLLFILMNFPAKVWEPRDLFSSFTMCISPTAGGCLVHVRWEENISSVLIRLALLQVVPFGSTFKRVSCVSELLCPQSSTAGSVPQEGVEGVKVSPMGADSRTSWGLTAHRDRDGLIPEVPQSTIQPWSGVQDHVTCPKEGGTHGLGAPQILTQWKGQSTPSWGKRHRFPWRGLSPPHLWKPTPRQPSRAALCPPWCWGWVSRPLWCSGETRL